MKYKTALLTFGQGGHTEYFYDDSDTSYTNVTSQGYDKPETWTPDEGHEYSENVPVIDKTAAVDTEEGFRWVFRGPMVDVNLPPAEVSKCPVPSQIFAEAVAGNGYGTLLALQAAHGFEAETPGPLDSVDIATYVAGWRTHGARIGKITGGRIVWDA